MPLVVDYKEVGSMARYNIDFRIKGRSFTMRDDVQNPAEALQIAYELQKKGYNPSISRLIVYDSLHGRSGRIVKEPERQNLSLERLEEIVRTNEHLPTHIEPIIDDNVYGADEGD